MITSLILAAALSQTLPITQPPVAKGEGEPLMVLFEPPTANEDGTALTDLAKYVLVLTAPTVDMNSETAARVADLEVALTDLGPDPNDNSRKQIDGSAVLEGQPAGQYRIWLAAVDVSNNNSAFATVPFLVEYDPVRPLPPKRMDIVVGKKVASSFQYDGGDLLVYTVVYKKEED